MPHTDQQRSSQLSVWSSSWALIQTQSKVLRSCAVEREAANAPSRLRAPHPLSVSARLSVRWAGMSRSVDGLYLNTGSISPRRGGTFYYTLAAVQQVGVRARVRKRALRPS